MEICVDFDGTCVRHEFPKVGQTVEGAAEVLQELVKEGHKLILFTMRANRPVGGNTGDSDIQDVTGNFLDDAIQWFAENNVPLYGIQTNPNQYKWTTSPKAYGHLYIDDAALGCPLIFPEGERPYVDWKRVREILVDMNVLE